MMRAAVFILPFLLTPAIAQNNEYATAADGAILRGLDRMNGELVDFELAVGESASLGALSIQLDECRFPTGNPSGDAFARIQIAQDETTVLFHGWMLASSPALNAMDHPRYDLWVLRCISS